MSVSPEPILLTMPEGLSADAMEEVQRHLSRASELTGIQFIALAPGVERAPQRVVHELPTELTAALREVPRIASALGNIATALTRSTLWTGPR